MKLPPGPRSPWLIQTIQLKARPLAYLDACAERYGDIFTVGGDRPSPSVYVSSPAAIHEILTADRHLFEPFQKDRVSRFLLGEGSLVFRQGEGHQRERRLLTPPLHGERLRANASTIAEIAAQVSDRWRVGEPVFVGSAMREIALRVIFRLMFDADEGDRLRELRHLYSWLMKALGTPLGAARFRLSKGGRWPLEWRRLARVKRDIDRLVHDEILERRGPGRAGGHDVLGALMSARDATDQPMRDDELHDEVMTLLFAGHETTASALAWALYWLHASPDVHAELRRELEGWPAATDPADASRLPYLAAVCQETLRLGPPCLSLLRVLKTPLEVAGYRLPAGTTLIISIHLVHRRHDLYPEPARFDPARFLVRQFSMYEYLPFGGGHRVCLGMALALFEMKLVLATILSRWELERVDHRPVQHARRVLTAGPRGEVCLVPIRRRRPGK